MVARGRARRWPILAAVNATIRPFASFTVGQRHELTRAVTARDIDEFAALSGDDNAVHLDESFGRRTRFGGRIAHGALTFGFMAATQTQLVGAGGIWVDAGVRFLAPVRIGDTVTTVAEIAEILAERRILKLRVTTRTSEGTVVMTGESTVKHPRELDG
jgi:acyl dehydratase